MSKYIFIFIYIGMISFVVTFSTITPIKSENLEDYVRDLSKNATDFLNNITNVKNQTNNTEVIQILNRTSGIEEFSQSAQVMKVTGVKDSILSEFINHFVRRLKIPEEHKQNVTVDLNELSSVLSKDWQSYKFIFNKDDSNSSLFYICILAQHDINSQKSNWIYTEVDTQFKKSDIFVISKRQTIGSTVVENVEVLSKPANYDEEDLELMMKFYEIISVKSFEKYLGIGNENLKFMEVL